MIVIYVSGKNKYFFFGGGCYLKVSFSIGKLLKIFASFLLEDEMLVQQVFKIMKILLMFKVICDNLQGFINTGFFFMFFAEVRRAMKEFCCKPFYKRCCKRLRDANVSLPVEMEQLREESGDHTHLLEGEEDQVHFTQEPGHPDS